MIDIVITLIFLLNYFFFTLLFFIFLGTALVCEVSARDGDGIDGLVEGLLLQADVMELKAAHTGQAEVRLSHTYSHFPPFLFTPFHSSPLHSSSLLSSVILPLLVLSVLHSSLTYYIYHNDIYNK